MFTDFSVWFHLEWRILLKNMEAFNLLSLLMWSHLSVTNLIIFQVTFILFFLWKFKWEGRKVINFYFYFYRISVQLLTFSYSMIFDALFYEYHLISMNSISSYRKHLVIAWYLMNGNKSISSDDMKFSDFSL